MFRSFGAHNAVAGANVELRSIRQLYTTNRYTLLLMSPVYKEYW